MVRGLTGLRFGNLLDSGLREGAPAIARNLGGTETPENGATSVDVLFYNRFYDGAGAMGSPTLVDDPASTLEPDTYHYAVTTITPRGETSAINFVGAFYQNIEITEAGKAISIDPRGFLGFERRLYRGRPLPLGNLGWEGYWSFPPRNGTFTDDGNTPFDGKGMPPSGPNHRPELQAEDDAEYQILVQPSWHTTTVVRNKATTGFTIEFGTPPADDQQTVTWLMFRP